MATHLKASDSEIREAFGKLRTGRSVARLLEVDYSVLTYYLYRKPLRSSYTTFHIAKRSGGKRTIRAPISPIKILQRKLNYVLQQVYRPKRCVQGFVQAQNVLTNAQGHVRRSVVLNIDVLDFFPSINFGRVRGMFMAKPYNVPERAATVLAQLCCLDGTLPQGAPSSPVVSNMICGKLDSDLLRLARRFRCTYTRYADDITISRSRGNLPSSFAALTREQDATQAIVGDVLRTAIEDNGFKINPAKVRVQGRGQRQEVTGVVVNRAPNVKRKYIRQLRAMIHAIRKYGLGDAEREFHSKYYHKQRNPEKNLPSMVSVMDGRFGYLQMIRGESDRVYRRMYNQYQEAIGKPRPYVTEPIEDVKPSLWVLESKDPVRQGTGFLLEDHGIVTCNHVLTLATQAFRPEALSETHLLEIIAREKDLDIAIIESPGDAYATLSVGDPMAVSIGDRLILAGFPNYRFGDTPYVTEARVASFRMVHGQRWMLLSTPIIAGMSGGAVLNKDGCVVGIAATGADSMDQAQRTEHHGVIPISALDHLRPASG